MKTLPMLFLCAITGAGGWLGGGAWKSRSPSTPIPPVERSSRPLSSASPLSQATVQGPPAAKDPAAFSKRAAMERLFAEEKGYNSQQRFIRTYAELRDLELSEFPQAIAEALQHKYEGDETAVMIASLWAERDPVAALTWILRSRHSSDPGMLHFALDAWSRVDAGGMFDWIETHASEISDGQKNNFTHALSYAAARSDPRRGRELMAALHPPHVHQLYLQWARISPAAAAEFVLREPDEAVRLQAIAGVAAIWAGHRKEPDAAIAWARQLPDPTASEKAMAAVGNSIGGAAGADFLAQLPQSNEVRRALEYSMNEWARYDAASAVRWGLETPDETLGRWVLKKLAPKMQKEFAASILAALPSERREAAAERWRAATENRSLKPAAQ